ncbi:unnamed protein product [Dracunculus medinensis]|uniref:ubiquitinyl hydrolase 1 n=1 Tax=Dracunculus medinensis TaxID=318479 RepID=A0A0N4UQA4_DRAME|nr:unnamed protein product [Dracunculus medinensis]
MFNIDINLLPSFKRRKENICSANGEKNLQMKCPGKLKMSEIRCLIEQVEKRFIHSSNREILYIVSSDWWCYFVATVAACAISNIRQISNESITLREDDHYILKPNIYEVLDYLLVREKDFEILNEWVGVALTERDIIKCLSFQTRDGVKKLFLSLYFKVKNNETKEMKRLLVDENDNIKTVKDKAIALMNIDSSTAVLFSAKIGKRVRSLKKNAPKWYKILFPGDILIISSINANLVESNNENEQKKDGNTENIVGKMTEIELCGLLNDTLTCYFNSAVQCLNSITELKDYFLNEHYRNDLNVKNETGGEILTAFAVLLKKLCSNGSVVDPQPFFSIITKYAPVFSSGQHDSHEFMAYLLNIFHESINQAEMTNQEVSQETWNNFLLKNKSIITQYMYGLLQSSIICTKCFQVNIKFDPFCFLTIPVELYEVVSVIFIPSSPREDWRKVLLFTILDGDINRLLFDNELIQNCSLNLLAIQVKNISGSEGKIIVIRNRILGKAELRVLPIAYCVPSSQKIDFDFINLDIFSLNQRFFLLNASGVNFVLQKTGETKARSDKAKLRRNSMPVFSVNKNHRSVSADNILLKEMACDYWLQYHPSLMAAKSVDLPDDKELDWPDTNEAGLRMLSLTFIWEQDFFEAKRKEEGLVTTEIDLRNQSIDTPSIHKLIDWYIKEEMLQDQNRVFCSKCGKLECARKKMDLCRMPRYLFIHLNRFQNRRNLARKVNIEVDIPVQAMDLSGKILVGTQSECVYDLVSVIHHSGSLSYGHYWAWVHKNNSWFNCDDSNIKLLDKLKDPFRSSSAYILLYRRSTDQATENLES